MPRGQCALQVWHDSPRGRRFGPRHEVLLRLLAPALRAGVAACLQLHRHRAELLGRLDALGASLVCDKDGREVHRTPDFQRLLQDEPEADRLLRAAHALVARQRRLVAGVRHGRSALEDVVPEGRLVTAHARYTLRASVLPLPLALTDALALVLVERQLLRLPTADEIAASCGLTPAQARVAHLLAQGSTNAAIAQQLGIRPRTAERHTEDVLRRLGVRTRAEAAVVLMRRAWPA